MRRGGDARSFALVRDESEHSWRGRFRPAVRGIQLEPIVNKAGTQTMRHISVLSILSTFLLTKTGGMGSLVAVF
jgi:hypothetical protein